MCIERYDSIETLIQAYPEFDAFLIDMAVGLRSSADQLRPDDLARKELGPRSSSIFPIPCRQAVYADPEKEVIQAYDVWKEKKNYGKVSMGVVRTTYLIDENGIIVKAFDKVKAADNPAQMLGELV